MHILYSRRAMQNRTTETRIAQQKMRNPRERKQHNQATCHLRFHLEDCEGNIYMFALRRGERRYTIRSEHYTRFMHAFCVHINIVVIPLCMLESYIMDCKVMRTTMHLYT